MNRLIFCAITFVLCFSFCGCKILDFNQFLAVEHKPTKEAESNKTKASDALYPSTQPDGVDNEQLKKAVMSSNLFAYRLFDFLRDVYPNFVFSPMSISLSMALLLRGSNGLTLQEIYDAMFYNQSGFDNVKEIQSGFNSIGHYFQTSANQMKEYGYYFSLSNTFWINDGKLLNTKFLQDAKNFYHTEVAGINFNRESYNTYNVITKHINEKTRGAILTCDIRKENFDAATQMVIVNSMSFSAFWDSQMAESMETLAYFYSKGEFKILTTFIQVTTTLKYKRIDEVCASVLRMPLMALGGGKRFCFFVVLPDYGKDIEEVENHLFGSNFAIQSIFSDLNETRVNLMFPKHIPKSSLALDRLLPFLGVHKIFDKEVAELLYISNYDRLAVDKMFHEAIIDLKTKGSFSYPVRYTGFLNTANHGKNIDENITEFFANRPFLYFVLERDTKALIYTGKLSVI